MSELVIRSAPRNELATVWGDDWTGFQSAFDRLREEVASAFDPQPAWVSLQNLALPPADIEDLGTSFEVRVDLPGFPKERIDVSVHGSVLEVKAEQATETEEKKERAYLRRERTFRSFARAFELPEPVVADQVQAKYADGVLTVTIPKAHPVTEKKIPVA